MVIYKYPLDIQGGGEIEIAMPINAKILCVQVHKGIPCLWVIVEETQPRENRRFYIYGTGHPMPMESLHYIGTFQLLGGNFVGHIFESK